jgi:hypothetical protein
MNSKTLLESYENCKIHSQYNHNQNTSSLLYKSVSITLT